ncbi:MAG: enoyl-CoA hydratase [Candidatus Binatia bacterium]|nr:MAG: enoyl-CoA hydratase [Candidatus Binatia bacterium]
MAYQDFRCLRVEVARGVARVVLDHPPINLLDLPFILELDRLGASLAEDPEVRVVVLESADPDFFVAHADVSLILELPGRKPEDEPAREPSFFQKMVDRFRTMPKVTIAKIEGICRGGGSELVLSCDMRFAALGRAVLGQPEVAVGILPGGSGTVRLPRLVGRSRALEIVLGAEDFSAELAERYGYVNRALPPEELGPFVERLASRIASFPPEAVARAKRAVLAAEGDLTSHLALEAQLFDECLVFPEARRRMEAFLAAGGQTREVEKRGFGS